MLGRRRVAVSRVMSCAIALSLVLASSVGAPRSHAQQGGGFAWNDPNWRFTLRQRHVKVVLLAGSIGAFADDPYGRWIHQWCENAEVRNLSMVGYGAWQLYERFRDEVLENPRVPLGAPDLELWLMWNGGLNSVGTSHRTNHYIRRAFRDAHRRGMRVVGLSLTPWGSFEDERRWQGARALDSMRNTRRVVDFVMNRLSPRQALGEHAAEREVEADAPWTEHEIADIRIDLYDSRLRHRDAPLRDVLEMREVVDRDRRWRRIVEPLTAPMREARLASDSALLAEAGRWFLRPEYRAFDPVHPNREGHRVIAEEICPRLPESWGCRCPAAE